MAEFVILPAILLGLIIGIVELIFVHMDEAGMGWFTHALHAVPVAMLFTFITMNVPWVLSILSKTAGLKLAASPIMELIVIIIIGLIAMVKTYAAAAIAGRVGEKRIHVLIIGVLIIAAPYVWRYLLANTIGQYLPFR